MASKNSKVARKKVGVGKAVKKKKVGRGRGRRGQSGTGGACSCLFCGKVLKSYFHLEAHMPKHIKEKGYECEECGMAFSSASAKLTHVNNVHLNKTFECEKCLKVLKTQSALSTHRRLKHGVRKRKVGRPKVGGRKRKVKPVLAVGAKTRKRGRPLGSRKRKVEISSKRVSRATGKREEHESSTFEEMTRRQVVIRLRRCDEAEMEEEARIDGGGGEENVACQDNEDFSGGVEVEDGGDMLCDEENVEQKEAFLILVDTDSETSVEEEEETESEPSVQAEEKEAESETLVEETPEDMMEEAPVLPEMENDSYEQFMEVVEIVDEQPITIESFPDSQPICITEMASPPPSPPEPEPVPIGPTSQTAELIYDDPIERIIASLDFTPDPRPAPKPVLTQKKTPASSAPSTSLVPANSNPTMVLVDPVTKAVTPYCADTYSGPAHPPNLHFFVDGKVDMRVWTLQELHHAARLNREKGLEFACPNYLPKKRGRPPTYVKCREEPIVTPKLKEGHPGVSYKCRLCGAVFSRGRFLGNHMKAHRKNKTGPGSISCPLCVCCYGSRAAVVTHLLNQHKVSGPAQETLGCPLCIKAGKSIGFSKQAELIQHLYPHLNKRTRIQKKREGGRSRKLKMLTPKKVPSTQVIVKRPVLPVALRKQVKAHRKKRSGKRDVQCNICGRKFVWRNSLTRHLKTHHTGVSYRWPCELCGKRYSSNANLVRHLTNMHGRGKEAAFRCPFCIAAGSCGRHNLRSHLRQVHADKLVEIQEETAPDSVALVAVAPSQPNLDAGGGNEGEPPLTVRVNKKASSPKLDPVGKEPKQAHVNTEIVDAAPTPILKEVEESVEPPLQKTPTSSAQALALEREPAIVTPQEKTECRFCPRILHNTRDITAHRLLHSGPGKAWACPLCGWCYGRKHHVARHLTEITHVPRNGTQSGWPCLICPPGDNGSLQTFESKAALYNHLLGNHKNQFTEGGWQDANQLPGNSLQNEHNSRSENIVAVSPSLEPPELEIQGPREAESLEQSPPGSEEPEELPPVLQPICIFEEASPPPPELVPIASTSKSAEQNVPILPVDGIPVYSPKVVKCSGPQVCAKCGLQLPSSLSLKKHEKCHHRKNKHMKHACRLCESTHDVKYSLVRHIIICHTGGHINAQCPFCSYKGNPASLDRYKGMQQHVWKHLEGLTTNSDSSARTLSPEGKQDKASSSNLKDGEDEPAKKKMKVSEGRRLRLNFLKI